MTAALTNVVGSRSMFWTRRRERSLPKFSSWRLPNIVPPWWHSYWLSYCLLAVVLVWVSIFFWFASLANCTTFFILDPLSQQFLTCFFNFFSPRGRWLFGVFGGGGMLLRIGGSGDGSGDGRGTLRGPKKRISQLNGRNHSKNPPRQTERKG